MKKTLGYGYKLSTESIKEALWYYDLKSGNDLRDNKKEVKWEIEKDKAQGNISKNAKPRIFKIVVEVE